MQYHSSGVNDRAQVWVRQSLHLGANRLHYFIDGGAGISLGDGPALLLQMLAHQVYDEGTRVKLLKLLNLDLREQLVHAGKVPKFAFHLAQTF
jgi:hypothetical protein